jgi:hypothetical protein
VSTANLRGSFSRRATVVAASTLTIGLVAVVAPQPVTVSANAEVSTTTSSSALLAGQLTAQTLTPVIATTTTTSTTSRLATTSRTVTRAPVVAPYAFGTKGYNKWWARYYMVKRFGWKSTTQYNCLVSLWNKESSWNHKAHNRSSGAYGIPQALPGSKMAKFGSDWRTNPKTQIIWGLGYIKGRYVTPCGAWSSFQRKGWY